MCRKRGYVQYVNVDEVMIGGVLCIRTMRTGGGVLDLVVVG